jgi:hypothetical protein
MDNLPIISRRPPSGWKQQRHKRIVKTKQGYKPIIVNPQIHKSVPTQTPPRGPRETMPSRAQEMLRRSIARRPKWDSILTRDTGKRDALVAIQKKMEQQGIKLREGENVAVKIKVNYNQGMSVMGSYDFMTPDGRWQNVPAEFRQSKSSLIEYMQDCSENGTPVIYHTDEMGLLDYIREFEAIEEREPRLNPPEPTEVIASIGRNPDGSYVYRKQGSNKQATFSDYPTAMRLERLTRYTDRDLLGDRHTPQTRITEFMPKTKFALRDLIDAYIKAERQGKKEFQFLDHTLLVNYAKYLIENAINQGAGPNTTLTPQEVRP